MIVFAAYVTPVYADLFRSVGFFALSGALTNWLAIHMLFEKVPFLYGSGVIPNRFAELKQSIKQLMMDQFFTAQNIEQFIEKEERQGGRVLNLEPLLNAVDYEPIFDGLRESIMESSFGTMVQMLAGEEALLSLKQPFIAKMQKYLRDIVESERFKSALQTGLDAEQISIDITQRIEDVIDKRMQELTPQMVKAIIQSIIREHLDWLVVWGGVFGGLLGAVFSLVA